MDDGILIKKSNLLTVTGINALIPEFLDDSGKAYSLEYFAKRIGRKVHLIIVAYFDGDEAGYLLAYDHADRSFYCWMLGVIPDFRRKGILKALMDYFFEWAKDKGYTKIEIKTKNKRREMLAYLVKYGFLFITVIPAPNIEDNEILLEKAV